MLYVLSLHNLMKADASRWLVTVCSGTISTHPWLQLLTASALFQSFARQWYTQRDEAPQEGPGTHQTPAGQHSAGPMLLGRGGGEHLNGNQWLSSGVIWDSPSPFLLITGGATKEKRVLSHPLPLSLCHTHTPVWSVCLMFVRLQYRHWPCSGGHTLFPFLLVLCCSTSVPVCVCAAKQVCSVHSVPVSWVTTKTVLLSRPRSLAWQCWGKKKIKNHQLSSSAASAAANLSPRNNLRHHLIQANKPLDRDRKGGKVHPLVMLHFPACVVLFFFMKCQSSTRYCTFPLFSLQC